MDAEIKIERVGYFRLLDRGQQGGEGGKALSLDRRVGQQCHHSNVTPMVFFPTGVRPASRETGQTRGGDKIDRHHEYWYTQGEAQGSVSKARAGSLFHTREDTSQAQAHLGSSYVICNRRYQPHVGDTSRDDFHPLVVRMRYHTTQCWR